MRRLLRTFQVVMVSGPRQAGKSSLVRRLARRWFHLDLERPADFAILQADLEGFLAAHPERLVIDEAQRMPELFPALRHAVDQGRRKGRVLLTGSASPELLRSVSESLAGRIGTVELAPFTMAETPARLRRDRWFWGGYPSVLGLRSASARLDWLDGYVTTFLERDLPALGLRLPPARLRSLWMMLTHVHGNVLNVSDLARSLAVSSHTVQHYLDVLEGAYLIRRLHPHSANLQKRLTKSPKVYIRDTGLLHFLAGLRSPWDLDSWPRRGASFEGPVIEEIANIVRARAIRPSITFWRTQTGHEADLLVDAGRGLVPIEIKMGAAVDARDLSGLRGCMADLRLEKGYVVSAYAAERRMLVPGIEVLPWSEVIAGRVDFGLEVGRPAASSRPARVRRPRP